ncbi:MAG: hypothetical protein J2P21_28440 [Chloracidobacterium sp.]|nr:hypothetical protein [Chloracidobacterium sp.]
MREFDERGVIGRHARRRDDVQLRAKGGEDVGFEYAFDDHNPGFFQKSAGSKTISRSTAERLHFLV